MIPASPCCDGPGLARGRTPQSATCANEVEFCPTGAIEFVAERGRRAPGSSWRANTVP